MNIAVIGASGDIGREIVIKLIQERTMSRDAILQLVGRTGGRSATMLHGFLSDLLDAYAESSPKLKVVLEPEEISGDVIIFCAGQTVSTDPRKTSDRNALAEANAPIFEKYAQAIAKSAKGEEIIIMVTNPVELGVHIFSKYIDPSKIIGMGAFLDTIRFRREIALDLGVRRQRVRGLVIGQHGPSMVPLWSSVGAFGMDNEQGWTKLKEIRNKNRLALPAALASVKELLIASQVEKAVQQVDQMCADLRVFVKPYLTHMTQAKTSVGTAEIVLRLIDIIAMGSQVLTACQTKVCGEFLGVHSVIGVPVLINNQGILQIYPLEIWEEEERAFKKSAAQINELLSKFE